MFYDLHLKQCISLSDNSNDCTGTRCCSQQLCNTKCGNGAGYTTTIPMQTTEAKTTPTTTRIPVYVITHQGQHTTQQSNANSKY